MARILVVDDDTDILKVVEKVLQMHSHNVFVAQDATKAMDLLNSSLYDLLITDANMPRFSGFDLTHMVKSNKRFQHMAVCMMTSLREKKDIDKAIRAGVDDYIVKPIDPVILAQKVDQILEKKTPIEKTEFILPENVVYANAQLAIPSRICKISELGLVIHLTSPVAEGTVVQIASDFFRKIQLPAIPQLRVIACRKIVEFDYEINVSFVNTTESFRQKIRNWVAAQASNKNRGAA